MSRKSSKNRRRIRERWESKNANVLLLWTTTALAAVAKESSRLECFAFSNRILPAKWHFNVRINSIICADCAASELPLYSRMVVQLSTSSAATATNQILESNKCEKSNWLIYDCHCHLKRSEHRIHIECPKTRQLHHSFWQSVPTLLARCRINPLSPSCIRRDHRFWP